MVVGWAELVLDKAGPGEVWEFYGYFVVGVFFVFECVVPVFGCWYAFLYGGCGLWVLVFKRRCCGYGFVVHVSKREVYGLVYEGRGVWSR